jgi:signal transduction histidine kinase
MGLRLKILIVLMIVGAIPLISMGALFFSEVEKGIRLSAQNSLFSLADEVSRSVNRTINQSVQSVLLLSKNPIISSASSTKAEQRQELIKAHEHQPLLKDITLLNAQGQVRASVFHSFRGSWKTTSWYQSGFEGEVVISAPHIVLYPARIVITIAVPVKTIGDSINGVLISQMSVDRITEITQSVSLPDSRQAFILNRSGIVHAAQEYELILEPISYHGLKGAIKSWERAFIEFKSGEKEMVAVFSPIPNPNKSGRPDWSVTIIQTKENAFGPLIKTKIGLLIVTGVSLICVLLLSLIFSRHMTNRIINLVEATKKIGHGDFSTKISGPVTDEIDRLGLALNEASNDLEEARQRAQDAEIDLKYLNNELEFKVKNRTRELLKAKGIAEQASQAKTDFLANISHELRTPLTHIVGFAELLRLGHAGDLNQKQGEFINDIFSSSLHLQFLINDLLDMSRIETGRFSLNCEDIDLKSILTELTDNFNISTNIEQPPIELQLSNCPDTIFADGQRVRQIFSNLIQNALKFTHADGSITISAGIATIENRKLGSTPAVEISVKDTGQGIESSDFGRIFLPFEQVDSTLSKNYQGVGIGLALTKKLVEYHQGEISVESSGRGKGATFRVLLLANPRNDARVDLNG